MLANQRKRFFDYQGQRYAHILNPITGKPVMGAPRSISVFAGNCSLAGGMSSLVLLQGENAEVFLKMQKFSIFVIGKIIRGLSFVVR